MKGPFNKEKEKVNGRNRYRGRRRNRKVRERKTWRLLSKGEKGKRSEDWKRVTKKLLGFTVKENF